MGYSTINVDVNGPAGVIRLERPEKLNALSVKMAAEVASALSVLEKNSSVRAVVLVGSDKSFSTGADLTEAVKIETPVEIFDYNRIWRDLTYRIEHLFKPVIAAISGYCLTGGLELALACDIRIAAQGSTFGITSTKIGSVAGAGGTQRLPRVVGRANAMELLLMSEFIDATEAHRIGLVNRVVPEGSALTSALEMVEVLASRGPLSLGWMKIAVRTGMNLDLESALDLEAALSAEAFGTNDKKEGMTAFLEKRPPVFSGE